MKLGNLFALFVILVLAAQAGVAGSIKGKVTPGKSVVYLESASGPVPAAADKNATMDQRGLLFQPHVLVVQVGSTVDFLNSDKVQHNVFWPSISGDKKKQIEDAIAAVRDAINRNDTDAIKRAYDDLQSKFQDISAELYKQASAQAGPRPGPQPGPEAQPGGGAAEEGAGKRDGGDVVDAEFEVVDENKKK